MISDFPFVHDHFGVVGLSVSRCQGFMIAVNKPKVASRMKICVGTEKLEKRYTLAQYIEEPWQEVGPSLQSLLGWQMSAGLAGLRCIGNSLKNMCEPFRFSFEAFIFIPSLHCGLSFVPCRERHLARPRGCSSGKPDELSEILTLPVTCEAKCSLLDPSNVLGPAQKPAMPQLHQSLPPITGKPHRRLLCRMSLNMEHRPLLSLGPVACYQQLVSRVP